MDTSKEPAASTSNNQKMMIGTFHKTGTILIRSIFRQISKECGFVFWAPGPNPPPPDWNVFFHVNSNFLKSDFDQGVPTVIIVRDPRDVIISAAHYHCKQGTPGDAWMHMPDPQFAGSSYNAYIKALPNDEERYIFEMQNKSADTIRRMRTFPRNSPNVLVVKFETLTTDTTLDAYRKILDWLRFPAVHIPTALRIAERNSLFSGKVRSEHVRSGQPEQWRTLFTPRVLDAFRLHHAGAAEDLGYPAA